MPTKALQPGSTDKAAVKQLQDFLVQGGYLTPAQVATGPGIYGPATTAAVAKLQKDYGVDNSTGVGYWGPRTVSALQTRASTVAPAAATVDTSNPVAQLQSQLGVPVTGVMDEATNTAMNSAVKSALMSNPEAAQLMGDNDADSILSAYETGDWTKVTDLSGKPFTDEQQKAAVAQAEKALAPAFKAEESYDRSVTEDALRGQQEDFGEFQRTEADAFGEDKDALDQNAADQGVLFSGSRVQKLNDLRTSYQDRERLARQQTTENARNTARSYQYNYGNEAAKKMSDLYRLPGTSSFNPNVAGGEVRKGPTLSTVYNPDEFSFQGTKPVTQKANVQMRAARTLANTANKLSTIGYGAKF